MPKRLKKDSLLQFYKSKQRRRQGAKPLELHSNQEPTFTRGGNEYEPTEKQLHYVKARVSGMTITQASRAAGYADASSAWSSAEHSENLQAWIRKNGAKHGISPDLIFRQLFEGLTAESQQEFCTKEGNVVTGQVRPDHKNRHLYLETAARMMGIAQPKTQETVSVATTNILVLAERYAGATPAELLEIMQKQRIGLLDDPSLAAQQKAAATSVPDIAKSIAIGRQKNVRGKHG